MLCLLLLRVRLSLVRVLVCFFLFGLTCWFVCIVYYMCYLFVLLFNVFFVGFGCFVIVCVMFVDVCVCLVVYCWLCVVFVVFACALFPCMCCCL